jgi:hypothetical protein
MKQGPFPHRRLCCPSGSIGTTGPSATLPAERDFTQRLIRAHRFPATTSQRPGPGRASPVPAPTMRPFRSPYPGRFLTAALPGSSRRPWPSPQIPGLGSPLSPEGAKITGRQDSLHATDRPLAHPQGALDAGLRHRAFPPTPPACYRASWQLPGPDLPRQANASLRSDQVTTKHHLRTLGTRIQP